MILAHFGRAGEFKSPSIVGAPNERNGVNVMKITSPGNIRGKANTQAFSRLTLMFPGWRLILLMRMMPAYLDHIQRWPRSLIVRYAGARRGAYWSPIFGSFATTCLSKRMWYLMIFASFLSARFHLAYAPTTLGRITDLRLAYAEVTRKSYKS